MRKGCPTPVSFAGVAWLALLLAACGGGGGGESGGEPALATVRTVAYVVTECREDAGRRVTHQELRVRQGDRAPVTVASTDASVQEPPILGGLCGLYATSRVGSGSLLAGAFQRLGVSPDGSGVVFERTAAFSIVSFQGLPPDEEGFFFVRADGSGLRKLGPASRESLTRFLLDGSPPNGFRFNLDLTPLSFSADGRTVAYSDRGPGPGGKEAAQVMTLDVVTGARRQVTNLPPPGASRDPISFDIYVPRFLPDGTIIFTANGIDADGLHPEGGPFTVGPDGTDLKAIPLPVLLPGSHLEPTFQISGDQATAVNLDLPDGIPEVFLLDHENLLQLTDFHRRDTFRGTFGVDGQRVFLIASANPPELHGSNPTENCQIFSIDTLGTDLRQLTEFSQGGPSALGCNRTGGSPPGCVVEELRQDPETGVLVFLSSCDPFGTNPNGEQIFAMYPDGTGLQQLSDTRGSTGEADDAVVVELPGPFASTGVRR